MAKPKWYTLFAWGWTALFAVVLADVIFNNRTPYYEVKMCIRDSPGRDRDGH